MKIIKVDITDEQKSNLRILSDFLLTHIPPPKFSMRKYIYNDTLGIYDYINIDTYQVTKTAIKENYEHCDTVACAVGHGPLAGIKALPGETWFDYAGRAFGAFTKGPDGEGLLHEWCFSYEWAYTDDTPQGAAARINFVLEHGGVPDDYRDQMNCHKPLCYK